MDILAWFKNFIFGKIISWKVVCGEVATDFSSAHRSFSEGRSHKCSHPSPRSLGNLESTRWVCKCALLSLKDNRVERQALHPSSKKGQKYNMGNYSSVSLTAICGKILEQLILAHISGHLERRSFLKTYFCLAETFALSVELHQISCLTAFRKLLCISAAYIINASVIQKSGVGGIWGRAVGSSILMLWW